MRSPSRTWNRCGLGTEQPKRSTEEVQHLPGREDGKIGQFEAGQVLIAGDKRIGVCGSDIHVYHGKHALTRYPVVQGHEVSGIVEEVGDEVQTIEPGQFVESLADAVREASARHDPGETAAHWMAILAMDQHAHLLAAMSPRATLCVGPQECAAICDAARLAVPATILIGWIAGRAGNIAITVEPRAVFQAAAAAAALGAAGAVIPLLKVARVDPATVFRR